MREIKEIVGYTDLEGNFHTSKEDALLSSLEYVLEGCNAGGSIELIPYELRKNKEELLSLLNAFYEESESEG